MSKLSRRDFLKLVRNGFLSLSAGLTIAGLIRFLNFEVNPAPQTEYDLGPASDFPLNSRTVLSDPPVLVIHNEKGFAALSLLCTHLGCTVQDAEQGFECPCHGSRFNEDGRVQSGPAKEPLRSLQIQLTDQGHLKVSTA
jgi:cytochrome b6-f complex iron-sulfur subunit